MPGRIVFTDGVEAFLENGLWTSEDPARLPALNAITQLPTIGHSPDRDFLILQNVTRMMDVTTFYRPPAWLPDDQDDLKIH